MDITKLINIYNNGLDQFNDFLKTENFYELHDNNDVFDNSDLENLENEFIAGYYDKKWMNKFLLACAYWKWDGWFNIYWRYFSYYINFWNVITYNVYDSKETFDNNEDDVLDGGDYDFDNLKITSTDVKNMLIFLFV